MMNESNDKLDGVGRVDFGVDVDAAIMAVCVMVREQREASAVSVAEVTLRGELRYVAADGVGAEAVVGLVVPVDASVAGYVALSGQAVSIADVRSDPRFNVAAAEATGYVPRSISAIPIQASSDGVAGVLSILDEGASDDWSPRSVERVLAPLLAARRALGPARESDSPLLAMRAAASALDAAGPAESRLVTSIVDALCAYADELA